MYLFVSEGSAADLEADLLGWDEFHKGTLTVAPLAANHASLLELPKVGQVARLMLESLQQARGSTRTGHPQATLAGCALKQVPQRLAREVRRSPGLPAYATADIRA